MEGLVGVLSALNLIKRNWYLEYKMRIFVAFAGGAIVNCATQFARWKSKGMVKTTADWLDGNTLCDCVILVLIVPERRSRTWVERGPIRSVT